MKGKISRLLAVLLCFCLLPLPAFAQQEAQAEDITKSTSVTVTGYSWSGFLTDGNLKNYQISSGNATITLENAAGMAGIYLLFDMEYGEYTVTDNASGRSVTAGTYGMLHEYIDLAAAFDGEVTSVTLSFQNGKVQLGELSVYSGGKLPESVQVWGKPYEGGADLVLFATHGDDDQLFFAGLLPLYAGEKGLRVQVVYLTDHRNLTKSRTHEMLNGLWNVGVTAYPVFGRFADFRIDSLQGTYDEYARLGTTKEQLQSYVVEQLRRFKPMVAIGHDIQGEYGHGMHMVYTDLLINALPLIGDAAAFPDSAEKYGTWELPKLYLHLYGENQVTIDYDQPLAHFGGMTAFQVTQKKGYPCHESQQWTWFTDWINGKWDQITKASQIETYNPCQFGLYHSAVGADVQKNDFFENIVTYAEQERLEQIKKEEEEKKKQEEAERQEQLKREEEARKEQERLEKERLEQERLEKERQEQLRNEQEKAKQKQRELTVALICLGGLVAALVAVLVLMPVLKKKRRK